MLIDFIGSQFVRGGKIYTLSNIRTTADEARDYCASIDGKLGEFTNDEIRQNIRPILVQEYIDSRTGTVVLN